MTEDQALAGRVAELLAAGTATVSDALDRLGLPGSAHRIAPLTNGLRMAGPAYTVRYVPIGDPKGTVGDYIDEIPPGGVAVLDNQGRTDATVWGDILTEYAASRHLAGTAIWGVCRDTATALRLGYPMYSHGRFMRTGKDRVEVADTQVPVALGDAQVRPGRHRGRRRGRRGRGRPPPARRGSRPRHGDRRPRGRHPRRDPGRRDHRRRQEAARLPHPAKKRRLTKVTGKTRQNVCAAPPGRARLRGSRRGDGRPAAVTPPTCCVPGSAGRPPGPCARAAMLSAASAATAPARPAIFATRGQESVPRLPRSCAHDPYGRASSARQAGMISADMNPPFIPAGRRALTSA